jgi:hypothetical protein
MSGPGKSIPLSDWYELVIDDQLMQGDIFENCPVFMPSPEMEWPIKEDNGDTTFDVEFQDIVVMTQSCDLVPDQKSDMWLLIMCPIWKLSDVSQANSFLASSYGKEECRRGYMPGYHMIAGCEHKDWNREISIVSFREVWSLPLAFVHKMVAGCGLRPRMRSPYREHLAQSFARYFMRVGLPTELPVFQSSRAEKEAIRNLRSMDAETRKRVLLQFC